MIERADNLLVPNGISGVIEIHKNNISFNDGDFVIHKDDIYTLEMAHRVDGYILFRFKLHYSSNKNTDIYHIHIHPKHTKRVYDMFMCGFDYKINYNELDILRAKQIINNMER